MRQYLVIMKILFFKYIKDELQEFLSASSTMTITTTIIISKRKLLLL